MANVTPLPTIYDQANLQQQLQGMAPIVSYYQEKANWERAKAAERMQQEAQARQALVAHTYAQALAQQHLAGQKELQTAEDAAKAKALDLARQEKLKEQEAQRLRVGSTVADLVKKKQDADARLRNATADLETHKRDYTNALAMDSVKGVLTPDQNKILKTYGLSVLLNNISDPKLAASVRDTYNAAEKTALEKYVYPLDKGSAVTQAQANVAGLNAQMNRIIEQNPGADFSGANAFYTDAPDFSIPRMTPEQQFAADQIASKGAKAGSTAPPIAANVPLQNGEVKGYLSDAINSPVVQVPIQSAANTWNSVGSAVGNALYNAKVGWFGGVPLPSEVAPAQAAPPIVPAQAIPLRPSVGGYALPVGQTLFGRSVAPATVQPVMPYSFAPTTLGLTSDTTVPSWAGPRLGSRPLTDAELLDLAKRQLLLNQGVPAPASPIPVGP